ncbi:MAG: hypothetical protein A2W23_00640 [Planctomycetes bacterium RBG_16_43_13]|nr:MAG: hypothetical protein A2W23_00640 [Planctomycetes bacterium RBG_16_43_13]
MIPNTAKVVKAMSMFDIVIHLQSINNKSREKKNSRSNKSYPQSMCRELIRYKISYGTNTHYKLAYIIAILGEVVYLLLFQHGNIEGAMVVPNAGK